MSIPDMDWSGWFDELKAERDSDWTSEWERGYQDGVHTILEAFKKELYVATKEDPHYVAYIEDAINLIKKTFIKE